MKYNKDKISIITICFNSAKTIRQTIESVLNQTYSNIEYIIVDGMSSDNTLEIIKEYEQLFNDKEISYRYISEPDNGIYDAMNKGIRMATGEWIGIINSDDWYERNALNEAFEEFLTDGVDLVYGYVRFYRNDIATYQEVIYETELPYRTMNHQGIVYRKNLHERYGYYNPNYKVCSDYQFLTSCYLNGATFKFIDKLISHFRHGGAHTQLGFNGGVEEAQIKLQCGFIKKSKYYKMLIRAFLRKFM